MSDETATQAPDINDPFLQTYSGADYDKFIADADKDDRLGDQDFMVTEKIRGTFPNSGDPYLKLNGVLQSANNAKFNITFGAVPRDLSTVPAEHKRGASLTIRLVRELSEGYGVPPGVVEEGTVIRVKVDKDKVDKNTGKYYLRAVKILPKSEVGKPAGIASAASATSAAAAAAEF